MFVSGEYHENNVCKLRIYGSYAESTPSSLMWRNKGWVFA